jgi:hypothetical protein
LQHVHQTGQRVALRLAQVDPLVLGEQLALHKQARTTPRVRAQVAVSDEPVAVLARRYGVTAPTLYRYVSKPELFLRRPHSRPGRGNYCSARHRPGTGVHCQGPSANRLQRQRVLIALSSAAAALRTGTDGRHSGPGSERYRPCRYVGACFNVSAQPDSCRSSRRPRPSPSRSRRCPARTR